MQKLLWLAAAGAAGALCRYGLGGIVQRSCGVSFPCGTLAVNILGCFLFGLIWTLSEGRLMISGEARVIILIGFLGAFTTFSTYSYETAAMLRDAQWVSALWNVVTQNAFGIAALFAGLAVGRSL